MTAAHVLSDNDKVPLGFFGADGYSRSFGGDFVTSMEHDVAAKLLPSNETEALSHVPFLAEGVLGRAAEVGQRFYASVAGYPSTAAELKDKVTIDTQMDVYSNFAIEDAEGNVAVVFDKKQGARGETGHTNLRDPFGKSGGAIFGMPVDGRHIRPKATARLVAIATRWRRAEKRIQGPGISVLMPLLDHLCQSPDAASSNEDPSTTRA